MKRILKGLDDELRESFERGKIILFGKDNQSYKAFLGYCGEHKIQTAIIQRQGDGDKVYVGFLEKESLPKDLNPYLQISQERLEKIVKNCRKLICNQNKIRRDFINTQIKSRINYVEFINSYSFNFA